jgi:hypothetical protein
VSTTRRRPRALGGALACLLTATVLALLPATPAAALPDQPTNLQAAGGPIPTLTWDRVDGATKYQVQGAENSSFSPTIFSLDTVNTTYVPTRVLKSGTEALHWRVRSVDATGVSDWSPLVTDITATDPPSNLDISDGGTVSPPNTPPVISWDPVAGATGYDIEMDAEGDNVGGTVKTDVRTTTYVWPDPQGVGEREGTENFFVRVRAKFANNLQTAWSDYASYDVTQLPYVTSSGCEPGLACAPDPDTGVRLPGVVVQDVVFDWDPVQGAKQYEIWVALNSEFTNEVEKRVVYGTRYSPTTTYGNNNYFWKVRAINAANQPTPWPEVPSEFQRRWPHQPTLVYPPNTLSPTIGDDFYYQWTPVQHATRYRLDVGTDSSFSPGSFETCYTAQTTYTGGYRAADPCMPSQGQAYYWRVKALDLPKGVEGIYSDTDPEAPDNQGGRFVYDSGPVQLTSPPSGSTPLEVPVLRWNPQRDAERYRVIIESSDGVEIDTTTYGLSYTPSERLDPAKGPFYWTVQAIDADNRTSPRYGGRYFQVTATTAGGTEPLTPLAQGPEPVGFRFPSLAWQPLDGAHHYRLRVSETPGFVLPPSATPVLNRELDYAAVTDSSSYFMRPGTYTWWVEAFTEQNALIDEGPTSTFTITQPGIVGGQAIALDGMALDAATKCAAALADAGAVCDNVPATPVLDWEPVPGAGAYLLYLAEDPDFTNRTLDPYAITTNSRWTPTLSDLTALADNQSGEAYYWFVRPCGGLSPDVACGPDPVSQTDAATHAFRKVSPKVAQSAPAHDSKQTGTEITFSWADYRTTNASATFAGGAAPSHQSGMTYRLQVSQNASLNDNNTIDDVTVDQTTYTAPAKTYPEGDLFWRVQAIDAKGNRLSWSDTRKIVKETPANILNPDPAEQNGPAQTVDPGTYPTHDLHIQSGEFPFTWQAKDFDVTWKIEIYKNDDTTFSAGNRILSLVTKQAAFVPPAVLEASSQAYRWRVMRYDVTNVENKGRWSDLGRFFVDERPVTLLSPDAGSEQPPNGPVLTWQPYSTGTGQAAKYAVEVRTGAGAVFETTASTTATAWATVKNYPTGTYTWSVTAYDTNNKVMGRSESRTFTVDTTLTALTLPVIGTPDGTEVGDTLTSQPPTWDQTGVVMTYQWQRNGANIGGAIQPTFTTTQADVDKSITLKVTGKRPGYTDGVAISAPVVITAGPAPTPTTPPTISGVAAARETLSASPGGWPSGSTFTYQWFVNGLAVARETRSSYVVRTRDAGLPVKVRVTARKPGLLPGNATSAEVRVAKLKTTTTATLLKATIPKRGRAVINAQVDVLDLGVPLGKIQIRDGAKVVGTVNLKNDSGGAVKIRLKKLKPGKHKLTVIYLGSTATTSSKSKKLKLVVLKK